MTTTSTSRPAISQALSPIATARCVRGSSSSATNTRAQHPDWFNAPVPSFGDAGGRLLIVGLAPGLQGANRTGRPFTGDYAGDLLYPTLLEYGFAEGRYEARPDDGLTLKDCRIGNAVHCVPPQNKPLPAEINTCRQFLAATMESMPRLEAIVALGRIAHDSVLKTLKLRAAQAPFGHGAVHRGRPLSPLRQLPLLALQHEHRRADAKDVPQRVRESEGGFAWHA